MLHYFADVKYKDPNVLGQSFKLTIDSLLKSDEEVPVKVTFLELKFIFSKKPTKFEEKKCPPWIWQKGIPPVIWN